MHSSRETGGTEGARVVPDHCGECGGSLRRLASRTLIYLAPIPWGYVWQRSQQLTSRLAGILPVLYVQPEPLKNLSVLELGRAWRRANLHFRRGSDHPRPPRLTVIAPPLVPLAGSRLVDRLNGALMARTIARDLRGRGGPSASVILWSTRPTPLAYRLAEAGRYELLVYEMIDPVPSTHPMAHRLAGIERALIDRADLVLCSSELLMEHARSLGAHPHLLPNGVDVGHFRDGGAGRDTEPPPLAGLGGPIAGCHGTIGPWIDFPLLSFLSDRFPDVQFVMIGPIEVPRASLPQRQNLHWLGSRDYRDLPAYLSAFCVGLIPFRVDDYTRGRNPGKLFEYFATGKPVVSTDLPEVVAFGELVYVGKRPEELASALGGALAEQNRPDLVTRRRAVAESNAWGLRADQILHLLHTSPTVRR